MRTRMPTLAARGLACLALAVLLAGCGAAPRREQAPAPPAPAPQPAAGAFTLVAAPADAAVAAALEPVLDAGVARVEAFFGAPFPERFTVGLHPDRAAFDASFPPERGLGATACWMVASGVADGMQVLSPRVWREEACEHDPGDAQHLADLLAHELTHVFHGQRNPTRDFTGAEEVGWFAEGLAVLASGQLEREHAGRAREALEAGAAPARLAEAWSGPWRYGVCGSLARYADVSLGRDGLVALLAATSNEEILAALGASEDDFLERWSDWVLAGPRDG